MTNVNYLLNGKLQMTDDDTGEFEILTETGVVNVSKILDDIHKSGLRPQVEIKVMCGDKMLFDEQGGLFSHKDEQKVDSYFVCGLNLSKLLWDNTEEFLEITIKRGKCLNNGDLS